MYLSFPQINLTVSGFTDFFLKVETEGNSSPCLLLFTFGSPLFPFPSYSSTEIPFFPLSLEPHLSVVGQTA